MLKTRWLIIVTVLLLSGTGCCCTRGPIPADDKALAASEKQIRVLCWNTWLVPFGARDLARRSEKIPEKLTGYDIVGLQEVWRDQDRKRFVETLRDEYHVVGPESCWGHRRSGLMLLSRFPIENCWSTEYEDESGTDAFMNKGALYVRLRLDDGKRLDVIVTHVQANDPFSFSAPKDRERQIAALEMFIAKHKESEIPRLVMGDFNIDGLPSDPERDTGERSAEYEDLMSALGGTSDMDLFRQATKCRSRSQRVTYDSDYNPLARLGRSRETRLDYLLTHNPDPKRSIACLEVAVRRFTYGKDNCPLSDHYAIEAILTTPHE